jgi:hypothetical protein
MRTKLIVVFGFDGVVLEQGAEAEEKSLNKSAPCLRSGVASCGAFPYCFDRDDSVSLAKVQDEGKLFSFRRESAEATAAKPRCTATRSAGR